MSKSRRRVKKGRSSDSEWKKSKPLAFLLIAVIIGIWGYWLFFNGDDTKRVRIPQAYFDAETKNPQTFDAADPALFVTDDPLKGYPPYEHPKTGAKSLWEAWTCSNPKCVKGGTAVIFPRVIKMKAGITPPAEGEMPSPEYSQAFMMAETQPPACPICKKRETTTRYLTPEAKQKLEELRAKYAKKQKK